MKRGTAIVVILILIISLAIIIFSSSELSKPLKTGTQEVENAEELKSYINIEPCGSTPDGNYIIKITNNNSEPIYISTLNTTYTNKDGNTVEKDFTSGKGIAVNSFSEIVIYNSDLGEEYAQSLTHDFNYNLSDISSYTKYYLYKNFEINANNTGDKITLQVKNNNDEISKDLSINVLYYENGQIVNCVTVNSEKGSTIPPGESTSINVDYPSVEFDSYEVYFINASRNI